MTTIHDNPNDELDALLREWHDVNRQRAAAGRDALMQRLSAEQAERAGTGRPGAAEITTGPTRHGSLGRIFAQRYFRAAASLALMATLIALMIPLSHTPVMACEEILAPEAGRLDARDARGNLIGPCALKHTDVKVNISGPFTRVTVKQQYHNPYPDKIEAVYTFPLSHRSAVDRMIMTVGERVVEAEIKERQQARQIYESARQAGYVASLLEQERPNIFTQSVANIEPNANVDIEISYVEMLESKDGQYTFDFPMVVAPRYIPGYPSAQAARLPAELKYRRGVVLLGPAQLTPGQPGNISQLGSLQQAKLQSLLAASQPIEYPASGSTAWWGAGENAKLPEIWYPFEAAYSDGSKEFGFLLTDGTGQLNNRWFFCNPSSIKNLGTGYESNTDQVPDASRITPMPVKPPTRAGHDVSLSVSIDTGEAGPAIVDYKSDLHQIICSDPPTYKNLGNKINLALQNNGEIPNRDFVLHWRTMNDRIQEAVFTHTPSAERNKDGKGGFFTAIIAPPARVNPEDVPPRELVFVLDTSGSMSGQPIEKAKSVMSKAIDSMRPRDTFNIITFSGDTHILWERPRPNTDANRNEAQAFLASRQGDGGTEMMGAINAALAPTPTANKTTALTPAQLADLPADGRAVEVEAPMINIGDADENHWSLKVRGGLVIDMSMKVDLPTVLQPEGVTVNLRGAWATQSGQRILLVDRATLASSPAHNSAPLRIVMFLTDGQVGNDDGIIGAVKQYAATARVFSFGIGDSPNRYLLDGIAKAGRGESEYVNLQNDSQPAIDRFVKRIATPVLADIKLEFQLPDGVKVTDTIPPLESIPDLFDVKPLIIHGRYTKPLAGVARAAMRIHGTTGSGPYERFIEFNLPEKAEDHSVISTIWGRAKVAELEESDPAAISQGGVTPAIHQQIVALGEQFNIMTRFTSFVAVEKARMTIAGRTVLVPIPIELPEGMEWEGVFGGESNRWRNAAIASRLQELKTELRRRYEMMSAENSNTAELENRIRELQRLQSASQQFDPLDQIGGSAPIDLALAGNAEVQRHRQAQSALQDPVVVGSAEQIAQPGDIAGGGYAPINLPNGTVSVDDLLSVINNWGPADPPPSGSTNYGLNSIFVGGVPSEPGEWNVGFYVSPDSRYLPADGNLDSALEGRDLVRDQRHSLTLYNGSGTLYALGDQVRYMNGGTAGQAPTFDNAPGLDLNAALDEGGGFGGGGSGGGGSLFTGFCELPKMPPGGLFGSPDPTPAQPPPPPPSEDEQRKQVINIITRVINPLSWNIASGAVATLTFENNLFTFKPLDDDPATHEMIDKARALLQLLQQRIPELQALGGIDALPATQFDVNSGIVIYDVRDLIAAIAQFDESRDNVVDHLIYILTEFVNPNDWQMNGGSIGSIYYLRDSLIVANTPAAHAAIQALLKGVVQMLGGESSTSNCPIEHVEQPDDGTGNGAPPQTNIVAYDVRDLLQIGSVSHPQNEDGPSIDEIVEQLVNIIQENVDPDSWQDLGGDVGQLSSIGGLFVIRTTDANHQKIAELLKRLREIRGASNPAKQPNDANKRSDAAPKPQITPAQIAMIQRIGRLRRVIDQRLWPQVTVESPHAVSAHTSAAQAPEEHNAVNHAPTPASEVSIAVLVSDKERQTVSQLESAGLRVDDIAKSLNMIGGTIAVDHLDDLALLECVRRIEPVPGVN